MNLQTKLHGFDEFGAALRSMKASRQKNMLRAEAARALRIAFRAIKAAVPISIDRQSPASKKYGRARDNIRIFRLRRQEPQGWGARIDTGRAFWLFLYEIGTRFQRARPFFRQAYEGASSAVIAALARGLGIAIEKELRKNIRNAK